MRASELILQQRKVKVAQASPHVSVLFIETEHFSSTLPVQLLLFQFGYFYVFI